MNSLQSMSDDDLMKALGAPADAGATTDLSAMSDADLLSALEGGGGGTPASFNDRFNEGGSTTNLRPGLESGLVEKAEGMGRPTKLKSFFTGLAQGATANFADEASSGVNAAIDYVTGQAPNGIGEAYDKRLESSRRQDREASNTNPMSYLGGQVAGGIATAPALPGGAGIAGGMKAGAAYGALAGAGAGEEVEGRVLGAGIGAGTGLVVGAAVPAAIGAVAATGRGIGKAASSVVGSARGLANPESEAARRVAAARAADTGVGDIADDVAGRAAQEQGTPLNILESGGEATRGLARSAANVSPEARSVLNESIGESFETQAPRSIDFVRSMVGTADAGASREALQQSARAANKGAYNRAYAQGGAGVWDETLAQLVQAPAVQVEIKDAARRSANKAASEGFRPVKNPFVVADDGSVSLQPGVTPNLQFWDVVKQGLDDQINALQRSGKGGEAGDLIGLRNTLRTRLDELVPSYAEARRGAAAAFGAEDALEAGQKFVRSTMSNNDARRAVAKMSEPERKMFAEGFASNLIDDISRAGDRQSIVNKIYGSPQSRQRIEIALGKENSQKMEGFMRVETIRDTVRRSVQGNSTTVRQLAEIGLLSAGGAASALSGDYKGIGLGLLAAGLSRGRAKIDANVARKVAEMLISDDPAVVQKAIGTVAKNPRLLEAVKGAEDYIIKGLGPGVNDNVGQPLSLTVRPGISGMINPAASDGQAGEDPNR